MVIKRKIKSSKARVLPMIKLKNEVNKFIKLIDSKIKTKKFLKSMYATKAKLRYKTKFDKYIDNITNDTTYEGVLTLYIDAYLLPKGKEKMTSKYVFTFEFKKPNKIVIYVDDKNNTSHIGNGYVTLKELFSNKFINTLLYEGLEEYSYPNSDKIHFSF